MVLGNFGALAAALFCGRGLVAMQAAEHPYWAFHLSAGASTNAPARPYNPYSYSAGVQYVLPWNRLRISHTPGDVLQEVFYMHAGWEADGRVSLGLPSNFDGLGFLLGARYDWSIGSTRMYADLGSGFVYLERRSEDLPGRFNFTPFLDVGFIISNGEHPITVGIRYMHLSNGGTVSPNPGQNQLMLDIGVRF
jgi:hypothetical protein